MPPLLLDDEEAIAIAVGLRTAARASVTGIEETAVRALVKLEQILPAHLRRRVRALGSATISPPVGGPTVDPQHLTVIAAACRDSERLRFAYRSRDGIDSRREVEPHSLVNLGRRWYLVAWDRRREDWRSFRVDRLARPASTGVRFAARRLPAKDAAEFVKQSISGAPNRFEARVTLLVAADEIASRVPALLGHDPPDRRAQRASTAPVTTTSGGWRCVSRCSVSTSRCTSRPSWSSISRRWPRDSNAPFTPHRGFARCDPRYRGWDARTSRPAGRDVRVQGMARRYSGSAEIQGTVYVPTRAASEAGGSAGPDEGRVVVDRYGVVRSIRTGRQRAGRPAAVAGEVSTPNCSA